MSIRRAMRRITAAGVLILLLSPVNASARQHEIPDTEMARFTRSLVQFVRKLLPKNPSGKKSGPTSQGDLLGPPTP
jgi:hypothetical protein